MEIKSSKEYTKIFIACISITLIFWGIIWFAFDFGKWLISILSLVLIGFSFMFWISSSLTLVMDEFGCTIKFLKFTQKYSWSELNIEMIDYTGMLGYRDPYQKGVIFYKGNRKPRILKPSVYSLFVHPFKFFFVNFDPDIKYNKSACCPDLYVVSKDAFLEKMNEWGVKISK